MACSGCAQRRKWIKDKLKNVWRRVCEDGREDKTKQNVPRNAGSDESIAQADTGYRPVGGEQRSVGELPVESDGHS